MYIPPAISILCFCALLLPTAAITRHVPTSRIHAGPEYDLAQYLFAPAMHQISLPLPFTPVPLTLQNFAVILVGMVLGPTPGFSAMVLYLAEGALGLPVFTPTSGPAGMSHLLGPNGGFLFSYPLAAATAGWIVRIAQPITTRFR